MVRGERVCVNCLTNLHGRVGVGYHVYKQAIWCAKCLENERKNRRIWITILAVHAFEQRSTRPGRVQSYLPSDKADVADVVEPNGTSGSAGEMATGE